MLADRLGEDPRAELARRLAEYARYKEAAVELARRPILGRDVFAGASDRSELPEREGVLVVSLFSLLESMQRVLARIPAEQKHHTVSRVRLTLQECMVEGDGRAARGRPGDGALRGPAPGRRADARARGARVPVDLELAKIQALLIFQNVAESGLPEGPIRVRLAGGRGLDPAAIAEAGARADAEMDSKLAEGEADGGNSELDLAALEALIFASDGPIACRLRCAARSRARPRRSSARRSRAINRALGESGRPYEIAEVAAGFQFRTRPEFAEVILAANPERKLRLSRPALETLALGRIPPAADLAPRSKICAASTAAPS